MRTIKLDKVRPILGIDDENFIISKLGSYSKIFKLTLPSIFSMSSDDYDRCLNREEMQIIRHGVVNGMNAFSRKMENLIEEQMKNSDKSKVLISIISDMSLEQLTTPYTMKRLFLL